MKFDTNDITKFSEDDKLKEIILCNSYGLHALAKHLTAESYIFALNHLENIRNILLSLILTSINGDEKEFTECMRLAKIKFSDFLDIHKEILEKVISNSKEKYN